MCIYGIYHNIAVQYIISCHPHRSQGNGGRNCYFYIYDHSGEDLISLESVTSPGSHAGIGANGIATVSSKTKNTDTNGQFHITILQLVPASVLIVLL